MDFDVLAQVDEPTDLQLLLAGLVILAVVGFGWSLVKSLVKLALVCALVAAIGFIWYTQAG